MIENPSDNNKLFFGRSPYLQAVMVEGNVQAGDIIKAEIMDGNLRTLKAKI